MPLSLSLSQLSVCLSVGLYSARSLFTAVSYSTHFYALPLPLLRDQSLKCALIDLANQCDINQLVFVSFLTKLLNFNDFLSRQKFICI